MVKQVLAIDDQYVDLPYHICPRSSKNYLCRFYKRGSHADQSGDQEKRRRENIQIRMLCPHTSNVFSLPAWLKVAPYRSEMYFNFELVHIGVHLIRQARQGWMSLNIEAFLEFWYHISTPPRKRIHLPKYPSWSHIIRILSWLRFYLIHTQAHLKNVSPFSFVNPSSGSSSLPLRTSLLA